MNPPCRIVLVRPEVAGNIGATARLMRNFGHSDLVLVAPVADPLSHEARQRSTQGEAILRSARIVTTLAEAVGDCTTVVGTSARTEGLIRSAHVGLPRDVFAEVRQDGGRVALVFGPEPHGLTSEEVARCDRLISIPTSAEYPALNLSHAVAICLYEWANATRTGVPTPERMTTHAERERAYDHLRAGLEAIHFLFNEKADLHMAGLRRLFDRARPTPEELGLLHGIARQMEWCVRNGYLANSSDE